MDAAKADLMRALGRLVRGLSLLFWGIPLALAADVETARTDWLRALGAWSFAPALVLSGLLWFGLRQLRGFQRQERVWQQALHRTEFFAIVNTGLAPFLFWWHRFPLVTFYFVCVHILAVSGFLFLIQLNQVLRRLAAMLPDEMLRMETRTFAAMNTWMLSAALGSLPPIAVQYASASTQLTDSTGKFSPSNTLGLYAMIRRNAACVTSV